ncbi:MAG: PAS domain-containing sensor histidine kinase [Microthrixaceae bacterium]
MHTVLTVALGVVVMVLAVALLAQRRRLDHLRSDRSDPFPTNDPVGSDSDELGRLIAALDAIDLGVVIAGPDRRVEFRNRVAARILGADDESRPVTADPPRVGDPLVRHAMIESLAEALDGRPNEREVDFVGPPPVTYRIRTAPLVLAREHGAPAEGVAGVAVVEDITARRRIDRIRRDFVSNISHELKTPVGALGLLTDTIAEGSDPETMTRLAERLGVEVRRLACTIDDLLELSRIEFANDLVPGSIPVDRLFEEVRGRFEAAAGARRIVIRAEVEDGLSVYGDRRQLLSGLGNLVDNAVKYSHAHSEVRLSARLAGDRAELEVSDDGDGIPTRDLDRVFERFFRVDRARSRDTGGTGLGLAIVRHVAQNHGGSVSVRSARAWAAPSRCPSPWLPQRREGGARMRDSSYRAVAEWASGGSARCDEAPAGVDAGRGRGVLRRGVAGRPRA